MAKKKISFYKWIIYPAIIGAVMTIVVCTVLVQSADKFPFSDETVTLAEYEKAHLKELDKDSADSFDGIEKNTVMGTAEIADKEFPLIYNADEVNGSGKLSILEDSAFFDETGCTFIYCKKNDSKTIKSLKKGNVVSINIKNKSYTFKITDTFAADNQNELKSSADGIGKSVAIYTDNSSGVGISSRYFVAVGQLI